MTLFVAIAVMAANWFILSFPVLGLWLLRLVVIPVEERELLAKFGAEYRTYMKGTGRMLPRFSRPTLMAPTPKRVGPRNGPTEQRRE